MPLRDLLLRVRALVAPRHVERELDEELAFHIEREAQKHIAAGMTPGDARARARARFGSVPLVADECRDARGVAVVETVARDVLYAFRAFRRAPLDALTIVATIGLGLGLVTVAFTVYNTLFLRTDAVRNAHELVTVEQPVGSTSGARIALTRRDFDALRRDTDVLAGAAAQVRPVTARVDGRSTTAALVSGNFFELLGVEAALGRTLSPGDEEAGVRAMVLSHRGWQTLFDEDAGIVGRQVRINGTPFDVVGVMPDGFRGLSITQPTYWVPLSRIGDLRPSDAGREDDVEVEVIGRLEPGVSPEATAAGLTAWGSEVTNRAGRQAGPATPRLRPRQGILLADTDEAILGFSPVFFAFGLVLLIGCANVANLLLARGIARRQEIGIRLSLGASRRRVVSQLLTESVLLAAASAACGLLVSRLLILGALSGVAATLPPELAEVGSLAPPAADWRVLAFLAIGALCATAFFAVVPAMHATRIDPMRTLRGELMHDLRPGRARQALIAVQVCASALLLICAGVFLRGAIAAAARDPGVRTSDTLQVLVGGEDHRDALVRSVTNHPIVTAAAASTPSVLAVVETQRVSGSSPLAPVDLMAVSPEYFDVLGVSLVSGRVFTRAERSADAAVAVVSASAVQRIWGAANPVGQVVRLEVEQPGGPLGSTTSRRHTIVGVVHDQGRDDTFFNAFAFGGIYVPAALEQSGTTLTLRVRGDPDDAREHLLGDLTRADPGLGPINTLRAMARPGIYILRVASWVAAVLGGLALFLTVSGLFSVLSYVVEQQKNDIGVRMALGASARQVGAHVLWYSVGPVGFGVVAGGLLALGLATLLLATPAAAAIGGVVRVLDPVAYGGGVLVICTACLIAMSLPAWRAARVDPIVTLKAE